MSTVTDRLLADLIARIEYPGSDYEYKRAPYAAEILALAEQQSAPKRRETDLDADIDISDIGPPSPHQNWDEARKRAHEVFAGGGVTRHLSDRFSAALDAFIAAMPPKSSEPQPEEVPEEVIGLAEAEWRRVIGVGRLLPCIAQVVWSAARRYSPMPAKVTAEMVIAACGPCGNINIAPSTLRKAIEAALAGAPKDAKP